MRRREKAFKGKEKKISRVYLINLLGKMYSAVREEQKPQPKHKETKKGGKTMPQG